LQATLPGGDPLFSDPLLFNNIFWDNRAGAYTGGTIAGIGLPGDPSPIFNWDLGVSDGSGLLAPTNSLLQTALGTIADPSNSVGVDPLVIETYDTSVQAQPWRGNPRFIDILMVTALAEPNLLGDYHLQATSPAIDFGADSKNGTNAPATDIDGHLRPVGEVDSGADEIGVAGPPPPPPPPAVQLYFSTANNVVLPGLPDGDDADIYAWDGANYSRIFDASVAGIIGSEDIDALFVIDADTFYMSFLTPANVPTVGNVDDSDIVLYDAGVWSLFFDGSDVGLTTDGEDVDAFGILPDDTILISTSANPSVPGLAGLADEDLLLFTPTSTGANTSGAWSVYFDGSDVGLTAGGEDVDGAVVATGNGDIYLSTWGDFNVTGLSGTDEDVFICTPDSIGTTTACASFTMFFDGSVNGITNDLDAISLP